MTEAAETIVNQGRDAVEVWIEPWAESIVVPPGEEVVISGRSDVPGRFEIDRTGDRIVVYAWEGCTALVRQGGTVIRAFDVPVPGTPAGMSMKGFVGLMFGRSPEAGAHPPPRRRWWRFW